MRSAAIADAFVFFSLPSSPQLYTSSLPTLFAQVDCSDHYDGGDASNDTSNIIRAITTRRQILSAVSATTAAALVQLSCSPPPAHAAVVIDTAILDSAQIYGVRTDSSPRASPSAKRLDAQSLVSALRKKRAIFLGEHHPDSRDHWIEADLIRRLHAAATTIATSSSDADQLQCASFAIGIEAVEQQFQPILDDYIMGRIDENELVLRTEWDARWGWPFQLYAPVFLACRELGIQILALNISSEDKALVERGGLLALGADALQNYIPDREGYDKFGGTRAFQEYVEFTLRRPFRLQKKLGLQTPDTYQYFLDRQALRDEAMASISAAWLEKNPHGLLVGLIGGNHIKFGCGVPARVARMLSSDRGLEGVASVLINPTPFDTEADLRRCDGAAAAVADETCLRNKIEVQNYVLQLGFAGSESRTLPNLTKGSKRLDNLKEAEIIMQAKKGSSVLALSDYVILLP